MRVLRWVSAARDERALLVVRLHIVLNESDWFACEGRALLVVL